MPKLIVLLASGTRGDVQPFIALALGLQSTGYRVRVVTHASFRSLVESRRLSFALLESNPSELLMQQEWESALVFSGGWGRGLRASLRFMRAARPLYARMLSSAWEACRGADGVIVGLATIWGEHIAAALKAPCLYCFLQPFSRTSAFPSALLPLRGSFGRVYNRLSHVVVEQALWQPWKSIVNRWRSHSLSLPKAPLEGYYARVYRQQAPVIYGFSSRVVPRPADWPAWHQVAGYWFLDEATGWTPPQALERFLQAGAAPVYIGFGSTARRIRSEVISLIQRALSKAGLRGVLALQGVIDPQPAATETLFQIGAAPHAWLFPRMAALVHHGGAGTTAAGLRAGVPALVIPQYADQFFWGERLAELGVGPRPIPTPALTMERFYPALEQVASDGEMRLRAQSLGREILAETGVQRAVEIIQQVV